MNSNLKSTLRQHLEYLVGELGPRPVASPSHSAAAGYIRSRFLEAGLHLEEIEIPVIDWRCHATTLTLNGVALPVAALPAAANTFSPACDVQAPFIPLCSLAELEAADLPGKIALFYGDLSNQPLIPLNCKVYNAERDLRINHILNARRPAALICVSPQLHAIDERTQDADLLVPAVSVPAVVGRQLLDHPGEILHLRVAAERLPATSSTLLGLKDGAAGAGRVTLMAHYDTMTGTPGALDNATGVAALLALAERLGGAALPLGLEFIAFGDHEYYAYSDIEYVASRGAGMAEIVLAINMDMAGAKLGTNNITLLSASGELRSQVEAVVQSYPGALWVDPWPESNHSTFAWHGVPSIALSSTGAMALHHQPEDTLEWVSLDKLAEVVALVTRIVTGVQDKTPAWTRPRETAGMG